MTLNFVELLAKTDMIGVGIFESLVGGIELFEILKGIFSDSREGRAFADQFPSAKYGTHEFDFFKISRICLIDMREHRVIRLEGDPFGDLFIIQIEHIPSHFSLSIKHPHDFFEPRIGNLFGVVRSLDFGDHSLTAFIQGG